MSQFRGIMVAVIAAAPARPSTATLDAVLERLTYVNEGTGYTVTRVATERGSDLLAVVGALLGVQPGESLRLHGWWSSHPKFGRQFEVMAGFTLVNGGFLAASIAQSTRAVTVSGEAG